QRPDQLGVHGQAPPRAPAAWAAARLAPTISMVAFSSAVGLNSTSSVPANMSGRGPGLPEETSPGPEAPAWSGYPNTILPESTTPQCGHWQRSPGRPRNSGAGSISVLWVSKPTV